MKQHRKISTLLHSVGFHASITAVVTLGIGVLVVATALAASWAYSRQLSNDLTLQGEQSAIRLSQNIVLELLSGDKDGVQIRMQEIMAIPNISGVAVYDLDSKTFHFTGHFDAKLFQEKLASIEPDAIKLEDTWGFMHPVSVIREEKRYINLGEKTPTGETSTVEISDLIGQAFIMISTAPLKSAIADIMWIVLVIGACIAAIILLALHFAVRGLIRPLRYLISNMREIESSGRFIQIKEHGPIEYQQIANVFNTMISALEERSAEISAHRDELEARVDLRTQELKQARDAALSASRHKSEFLANISHELRTPLNTIMGTSELAKEDLEKSKIYKFTDDFMQITRSSHELLDMINNLLDKSKIESGRDHVEQSPVNMTHLIADTVNSVRILAQAKNNKIDIELPKNALIVRTDSTKIRQILINLLSNAIKFTENGRILVRAESVSGSRLVMRVTDSGIGVPDGLQEYIFEQFTQAARRTNSVQQGSGLGLSICRAFSHMLGGDIYLDKTVSLGASFVLDVPSLLLSNDSHEKNPANEPTALKI